MSENYRTTMNNVVFYSILQNLQTALKTYMYNVLKLGSSETQRCCLDRFFILLLIMFSSSKQLCTCS